MTHPRWLPPAFTERAREFAARGLAPAKPRSAATVVLLRDTAGGLEAFLLRRRTSMAFAAGMHVFPGGTVDPQDVANEDVTWLGPTPATWAQRLGTDATAARGFVLAAVRETFEEAGILLASPGDHASVVQHAGPEWDADRQALVDRRLSLSELLARRELAVRTDLLEPWAHWVTPRFETRRYDTWFFVAALPEGQQVRRVSGEADQAAWLRPADAMAAASRGEVAMLPPTWAVLEELAGHDAVAEVLAAERTIERVMPGWVDDGDTVRVLLPGDPGFPGDDRGRQ